MEFTGKVLPVVVRRRRLGAKPRGCPSFLFRGKVYFMLDYWFPVKITLTGATSGRDLSLTNKLPARLGEPPKIMTLTQLQVRNIPDLIDR